MTKVWLRAGAIIVLPCALWLAGCDECQRATDCGIGEICRNGRCVPSTLPDSSTDTVGDTDVVDDDVPDTGGTDTIDPDATLDTVIEDTSGDEIGDTVEDDGPCTADDQCIDDNLCTDDYCHPSFHLCVNEPLDGMDCSPLDICDGVGTCNEAGECVLDSSPLCNDHNPCTFDTCLTGATDCRYDAMGDGSPCDNGLFCDGDDGCTGGVCMAADPTTRPCDDSNACTLDICAEGASDVVCTHEPTGSFRAVTCGATVTGTTSGSGEIGTYGSCTGTLGAGPEEIIVFSNATATGVTFTLVMDSGIPTADYNELYVLTDGCDPSTCTQTGATSVTVASVAAGTPVYVAVESVAGGALFAVQASCF